MPLHIDSPAQNRRVLLARRPIGVPQPTDFQLDTVPCPACGEGEVLVRNLYLSVDPAQRGWASAEANYSEPVALGAPMRALAVARVLESRAEGYSPGDILYGFFGWQDCASVPPATVLHRVVENVPLDAVPSLLGINGVTAYLATTLLGRPARGDVMVVSTAAGSVGSFAGQIAARLGARVIGLTGTDEKARICVERFGYTTALNYRSAELDAELRAQAPQGVNVYFDNVGGALLDRVLRQMAVGGRIVQCGTTSVPTWTPAPSGPRNEREILTRRLTWSGFVIFDHRPAYAEACARLASWWQDGTLTYETDIRDGIETAPDALKTLYAGENRGKLLIRLV